LYGHISGEKKESLPVPGIELVLSLQQEVLGIKISTSLKDGVLPCSEVAFAYKQDGR